MRAVRWAICGVWVCTACGKSTDDGFVPGQGGASTPGGASSQGGAQRGGSESGVGASIIAGGSMSDGGAQASSGGAAARGGSGSGGAVSLGGSVNSGGTAVAGGEAGASEAGAEGMCAEFLACGCGCCAGSPPQVRCSYADVPTDYDSLVAADEAARQSPSCSSAGCSIGARYLCCEAPPPDSSPASYSASLNIGGGYDRIQIVKMGTEFCPRLTFTDGTSGLRTVLDGLPGWNLEAGSYMSCAMSSVPRNVIGAGGSIKPRVSGSSCVLDMHFAVYALVNEELIRFRFDADGVPLSGASSTPCFGL